ncbi:MAG: endonuclease/exonuclease/phosphatase family protein [Caulobacteraceae bacterium]|nr:endonuclease/exonuclease/phosphatase family protein [Caulobacter sp.]
MTYNVHGCVGLDRRLDVERVAAVIAREAPDVVALQELDVNRARSGGVDQARAIAERLGMAVSFNSALIRVRVAEERYGDAILSRLPMRAVRSGPLPRPPGVPGLEDRGALWCEVELAAGARLQVVNTHLGLVPLEQRLQVSALLGAEWMAAAARIGPALLLGDFNATTRYAAYRRLRAALADLQVGLAPTALATYPARLPVLRIDHLFATPGVRALDVWAPNGRLARTASDHLPLVADLEVES